MSKRHAGKIRRLTRVDFRCAPALFAVPGDRQHVIGEGVPEDELVCSRLDLGILSLGDFNGGGLECQRGTHAVL